MAKETEVLTLDQLDTVSGGGIKCEYLEQTHEGYGSTAGTGSPTPPQTYGTAWNNFCDAAGASGAKL